MKPHRQRRHWSDQDELRIERFMNRWTQDLGPAVCCTLGEPWARGRSREARRRFAWAQLQTMRKAKRMKAGGGA